MVKLMKENSNKKYFRYDVKTTPYKDGFTKIDAVDNYFDKHDYAFVNLSTGEMKSYSTVALNYVISILKSAGMSMYDVKPKARYKFYTEPHSSKVIDAELIESKMRTDSVEIVSATAADIKKHLGYEEEDLSDASGRKLPDVPKTYFLAKQGDKVGSCVGYQLKDGTYGYVDTSWGSARDNISKDKMNFWLRRSLEENKTPVVEDKSKVSPIDKTMLELNHAIQSISHTKEFYDNDYRIMYECTSNLRETLLKLKKSEINLNEVDIPAMKKDLNTKLYLLKDIVDYVESDIEEFENVLKTMDTIYM